MKKILAVLLLAVCFAPKVMAEGQFSEYVEAAFESGIITGDENGVFDEQKTATRAEFAVMITRFLNLRGGINVFSDVEVGAWYEDAFSAANYHGLLYGYSGMAMPGRLITFEDAVAVIGRYYNAQADGEAEDVSEYAVPYYIYAEKEGFFTDGMNVIPHHYATKGEILALLYNYDKNCEDGVRFVADYPRISQENQYGRISVEIRTNKPCTIYYGLGESGGSGYSGQEFLCEIKNENETYVAAIEVDVNKEYDIYFKAETEGGAASKFASIENIRPFSIKSGKGTKESPYMIRSQAELLQISLNPSAYYGLGCDITLNGNWQPIPEFSGVFDGRGFEIRGLKADKNSEGFGLFGVISGGRVRNLTLNAEIEAKRTAGLIAGTNSGGTIENCTVTGSIDVKTSIAGGICGINRGYIKNCVSALYFVTANAYAGGICGQNFGTLENCLAATDAVVSDMYAGGISGSNESGVIEGCVSACMTVYDTLTQNSGRITTNKKSGITKNNYFYKDAVTNATYMEENEFSSNGYDVSWDELISAEFYEGLGWSGKHWKKAREGFRLIYPDGAKEPVLEPGRTRFMPKPVETAAQLRDIDDNETGHYILKKDISLNVPWKTLCAKNGFSGTLDGNGHTVYNLNLKGETGLFSNITGGTVENLTLRNVTAMPSISGAVLTACNYGYIRNCNIYGNIKTNKAGFVGTVAGENYGEISGCRVYADIENEFDNVTLGGICAENSGIVIDSSFSGKITSVGKNTAVGGICGFTNGGYVFESFAKADIKTKGITSYVGGVCAMLAEGQVYKCASSGRINAEAEDNIYVGGVLGMAENGVVYNCFSTADVYSDSALGYSGGIIGYGFGSNIQNTYSAGTIISSREIKTGGILGMTETGFAMQNVSLNPAINGGEKTGAIIGEALDSEISDNFSCEKTLLNDARIISSAENGEIKTLQQLKNIDFYFKPISNGGSLGWGNEKSGEDVWKTPGGSYKFPVLSGVKNQENLQMPLYR